MQKKEPLISVVIPAYNVEKYIERCIQSISRQTYSNIEILLVYTESEDQTQEACQKLAEKEGRMILLACPAKGVSIARNIALEKAKGEYIAFVDADDYVEDAYLMTLYQAIKERDISLCGLDRVKKNGNNPKLMGKDIVYEKENLLADILCNNAIGGYLVNKLFRTEIIQRNQLRFRKDLSVGEDMVFIVEYMKNVHSGYYCNAVCYHYCLNENSALQKMYTTGQFEESKLSNLKAAKYISEILDRDSDIVKNAVAYRMVRTSMWNIFNMLKCSHYDKVILRDIKQNMRGNVRAYCRNTNSKPLEKVCAICTYINPQVFWHIAHFFMHLLPEKTWKGYVS